MRLEFKNAPPTVAQTRRLGLCQLLPFRGSQEPILLPDLIRADLIRFSTACRRMPSPSAWDVLPAGIAVIVGALQDEDGVAIEPGVKPIRCDFVDRFLVRVLDVRKLERLYQPIVTRDPDAEARGEGGHDEAGAKQHGQRFSRHVSSP